MGRKGPDSVHLDETADRVAEAAQDVTYVTVGLGVLGFQKAQVRRRELNARLAERLAPRREEIEGLVSLTEQIDDGLDSVVAKVAEQLPAPAGGIVSGLHRLGRSTRDLARSQVREIVG